MRRKALVAALPLLLAAAACGTAQKTASGASPAASASAAASASTAGSVSAKPSGPVASAADIKVEGGVGKKPSITFPAGTPDLTSAARRIVEGEGEPIKEGDLLKASVTSYAWDGKENKATGSDYDRGGSQFVPVTAQLLKPLHDALVGAKPGGRVLAVIAKDSFQPQQLEQFKQQGADFTTSNQVMVIDIGSAVPTSIEGSASDPGIKGVKLENPGGGKAPVLTTKTDAKPSSKLVVKTVIKGSGPKVKADQMVAVNYVGKIWGTDKQFDSSWERGQPATFPLNGVVKGWSQGLTGVPVGSRVLITIPPELGYGKQGNPQGGIKGTDTLVFVVDVLGVAA